MKKKVFLFLSLLSYLYSETNLNRLGISVGVTSIKNSHGSEFNNYGASINYKVDSGYNIAPRFDFDYVKISHFYDNRVSNLLKGSINGVYEFENRYIWTPYILAGLGYEFVSKEVEDIFESHFFLQGGVGVNYDFKEGYKAQLESRFLQIINGNNENNEIILNFGMSFPLVKKRKKKKVIKRVVIQNRVVVPPPPPPPPPPRKIVVPNPDKDGDGVLDQFDQCPNTPRDFSVDKYGCPIKVTLQIHFGVNSSKITRYSMPKVVRFAQFLLKHKGSKVLIVGHTDSDGSSDKNLILSQKRARSVANKLIELGVSPSRITAIGKGESMPIASNKTEEGKRKNRRIEAILTYPKR